MNKKRKSEVANVICTIREARNELENLAGAEDDARDNMPENLQGGEAYEKSEACSDALSSAIDTLDEAIEILEEIV